MILFKFIHVIRTNLLLFNNFWLNLVVIQQIFRLTSAEWASNWVYWRSCTTNNYDLKKNKYLNLMQFSSLILCISACSRQLNIQQFPIRSDLYFSHDCHNSKATNSTEMHFDKIYSGFPKIIPELHLVYFFQTWSLNVKFSFSEKTTKICTICLMVLTFTK